MSGPTIQPMRAALVALWAAVFDPEAWQVSLGSRVTVQKDRRLAVLDAEGTTEPESLGPRRTVVEEYDVRCIISVTQNGSVDDQANVSAEVMAAFDAAELAVRGNPQQTLGVPGVVWCMVAGAWKLTEATASETGGPINTSFEFRVHVNARYQLA